MSRLTRDGTAERVSRDQIFRCERGQEKMYFPFSADHEQNWQPYPVYPYSAISDDYACIDRALVQIFHIPYYFRYYIIVSLKERGNERPLGMRGCPRALALVY